MPGLELDIGQHDSESSAPEADAKQSKGEIDEVQLAVSPETITDPEKAHSMAIASNRNELNLVAFKRIALEHMKKPDTQHSPLRAEVKMVKDEQHNHDSNDPKKRIVKTVKGGYALQFTADEAIEQAQKERAEADRVAQIAADRHDALENL